MIPNIGKYYEKGNRIHLTLPMSRVMHYFRFTNSFLTYEILNIIRFISSSLLDKLNLVRIIIDVDLHVVVITIVIFSIIVRGRGIICGRRSFRIKPGWR